MSVNNIITSEAGQYSHISVMIEWLKDLKDTFLLWSDLIKIPNQTQVDSDLSNYLLYCKMIEFKEQNVFIMSQTEAELFNEEMKTMQWIKNNQFKVAKAAQFTVDQSGFSQSEIVQSELAQSEVTQTEVAQSEFV